MKRGLLLALLIVNLILPVRLVNAEDLDRITNPEAYTERIIIKEYEADGSSSFKSVPKADYHTNRRGISSVSSKKIEYIQPDYIRYITNESTSLSPTWGGHRIGIPNLLDKVRDKKNEVIVAVLDTGIDAGHPIFKDRIVKGYNFVEGNNDTMDRNKHGTHVAGIVAASTNDNVKIMPIKVLGDDGKGSDYQIVQGIDYALANGAEVINMSFTGPGYSPYMEQFVQYAQANGATVIVAAGNDGMNTRFFYPASSETAIVVSATDINDHFAEFSNYGESVDIASPGVDIYSSIPNNLYAYLSGTSMSTAFVSATASLLKQEDVERTPDIIEDLLLTNTEDLGTTGRDNWFGEGIINFTQYKNTKAIDLVMEPVERLAGANRIETAVEVSKVAYAEGAEAAVLAGYHGEVDALAGTLLAHTKKAPILLTQQQGLSKVTKDEILRLGAKTVHILGGETVVSKKVVNDLEALSGVRVKRVSGANRYETAHKIAKEANGQTSHVFLALGVEGLLADALSVGPVSGLNDMPVLLTTENAVPQATKEAMQVLGVTHITIVGGENAVSQEVQTELAKQYVVDRVAGDNRVGTAQAVAQEYFEQPKNAVLAYGWTYADALVGGYLGALMEAPILLTQTNALSELTTAYIAEYTDKLFVLGGPSVIAPTVIEQAEKAIIGIVEEEEQEIALVSVP